jgi:hypothetical protein
MEVVEKKKGIENFSPFDEPFFSLPIIETGSSFPKGCRIL